MTIMQQELLILINNSLIINEENKSKLIFNLGYLKEGTIIAMLKLFNKEHLFLKKIFKSELKNSEKQEKYDDFIDLINEISKKLSHDSEKKSVLNERDLMADIENQLAIL